MTERMGDRQRWAWLAGGMSVLAAAKGCSYGWTWVLGAAFLVMGYYQWLDRYMPEEGVAGILAAKKGKVGKAVSGMVLIWMVILMAWTAQMAEKTFPEGNGRPIMGWTMLALAAWGSWKGTRACASCAGVLCLFLAVFYGIIGAMGAQDMQWKNMIPDYRPWEILQSVLLFGSTCTVWYLPCRREGKTSWRFPFFIAAGTGAMAAVTAGVLSPKLMRALPVPVYAMTQAISLFGVIERIEPLLSAAMTMGIFCLLAAMSCTCREITDRWGGKAYWGAVCCGAAGMIMAPMKMMARGWPAAAGGVICGIIPLWIVRSGSCNGTKCGRGKEEEIQGVVGRKKWGKKAKKEVDKGRKA